MQYRTGAVPDRQSPGGFPRVRGLPDYVSSSQPAGALTPGAPGMPISPKLAPTNTPRSHLTTSGLHRPVTSELLSPRIHSHLVYKNMSGLSPYRCYTVRAFTVPLLYCSGFHRTAVLSLDESHTTWDPHGSPYLSTEHNPPNTFISIHTTHFTLSITYSSLSQDRSNN